MQFSFCSLSRERLNASCASVCAHLSDCISFCLSACLCVSSLVESPLNRWCVDVCANVCMPLKMRKRQCSLRLYLCFAAMDERSNGAHWHDCAMCSLVFPSFVFSVFLFVVRVLIAQFAYRWWAWSHSNARKIIKIYFPRFSVALSHSSISCRGSCIVFLINRQHCDIQ